MAHLDSVLWDPSESDDAHNIAYLDDSNIHVWDLNTAKVDLITFFSFSFRLGNFITLPP